jgi:hypothetical protein
MILRVFSGFDASFTFNLPMRISLSPPGLPDRLARENHRQEKDMKKENNNNINNFPSNYLPAKLSSQPPVKEVKEGSEPSGNIDSLIEQTENDFQQAADHAPPNAQNRTVALVDLRRDLCRVWNIHLPQRSRQHGTDQHHPFWCGGGWPGDKRILLPQRLEGLPRRQKSEVVN